MLISITAPKKGLGQSVTAINIIAMLTKIICDKALLIDTNKYYKDISYYLSDSLFTKGLDDFKNLVEANMINDRLSFYSCTKKVNENIDIMASNESQEFDRNDIKNLVRYSNNYYPTTVIDTIAGNNLNSRYYFEESDVILVVLNQDQSAIYKMIEEKIYDPYKEKIIFVVNRYINKYGNEKVKYTLDNISKTLNKAKLNGNKVFKLNFEVELINECNDNTILNYILNNSNTNKYYISQIREITQYILENFSNKYFGQISINDNGKKSFFDFLKIFEMRDKDEK